MWQAGFIHRFAGENQISTNHSSRWACLLLHIWQPRSRLHMTSPAALRSSRNAQRCSESKTAASPSQSLQKHRISSKRSFSASTPSSSICRGCPPACGIRCFFCRLLYFSRCYLLSAHIFPVFNQWIFWVLLTTEVTYCFQQESAIASHEWGRFPTSLVINISAAWA